MGWEIWEWVRYGVMEGHKHTHSERWCRKARNGGPGGGGRGGEGAGCGWSGVYSPARPPETRLLGVCVVSGKGSSAGAKMVGSNMRCQGPFWQTVQCSMA